MDLSLYIIAAAVLLMGCLTLLRGEVQLTRRMKLTANIARVIGAVLVVLGIAGLVLIKVYAARLNFQ